jgi:uncharacterized protein
VTSSSPSRALLSELVATSVSLQPPRASDGRWLPSTGERSIRESLWNILLTAPGERLLRPEFGAGLARFIHQPNDETTRSLIAAAVRRAIERWEPRILLDGVEVVMEPGVRTELAVSVRYRMRHGGQAGVAELRVRDTSPSSDESALEEP